MNDAALLPTSFSADLSLAPDWQRMAPGWDEVPETGEGYWPERSKTAREQEAKKKLRAVIGRFFFCLTGVWLASIYSQMCTGGTPLPAKYGQDLYLRQLADDHFTTEEIVEILKSYVGSGED